MGRGASGTLQGSAIRCQGTKGPESSELHHNVCVHGQKRVCGGVVMKERESGGDMGSHATEWKSRVMRVCGVYGWL